MHQGVTVVVVVLQASVRTCSGHQVPAKVIVEPELDMTNRGLAPDVEVHVLIEHGPGLPHPIARTCSAAS